MSISPVAALEPAPIDWPARADALTPLIAGNAPLHDAEDSFVAENYARLKADGFFAAHVPVELGGGGADYAALAAVIRR
ncbi:MAG TPA: acyl-CoA dehydrogenase family protein, partial [Caulobacteraceae bacterium]|nr:acyl-CoA dehydrogenase family protein [Caulobacteraceae bacterium]